MPCTDYLVRNLYVCCPFSCHNTLCCPLNSHTNKCFENKRNINITKMLKLNDVSLILMDGIITNYFPLIYFQVQNNDVTDTATFTK